MGERISAAGAPSIRRTLLLYLGALSLLGAVALYFAARNYGQRAANRSYDHLLVSSALSIADSVALVDGDWQVIFPTHRSACWRWRRRIASSTGCSTHAAAP